MSKVYQALKKVQMEKAIERDIIPSSGEKKEPFAFRNVLNEISLDEHLVPIFNPRSVAAEQYRKLRTRILQFRGSTLKTVLITSPSSQEGKTLTSANLAITMAQGVDQHVLLVDCDLRRPSIHKLFALSYKYGLTDYLKGDIELSQILLETGIPRLKLLPSGSPTDRPSELIASEKMKNLVKELKSRYDNRYIIVDSTPILATDEPDILAKQVDCIILVIRSGKTSRELIERTSSSLNSENLLGIVFNEFESPIKRLSQDYYGHYAERGK